MKYAMHKLVNSTLGKNKRSYIINYESGFKKRRTYNDLFNDVDEFSRRFKYLRTIYKELYIGILGGVSYDWLVVDLGCIKAGVKSVALPEYLSEEKVSALIQEKKISVILLDYRIKDKFRLLESYAKVFYINCPDKSMLNSFWQTPKDDAQEICLPQDEYGICFSSGTTENIKAINLKWPVKKVSKGYRKYTEPFIRSLWSRRNNTIIIYMPFSHFQQREFAYQALLLGVNIILSDPINCIKHIIVNKPNIMISVPAIYELLALRIDEQVKSLPAWKQQLYEVFNSWKINELSDYNMFKMLFSNILFKQIKKLYGGRAEFFVCGSAPITLGALKTFHGIGVKILEAYGQSEVGMIAMNSKKRFKLGSVGIPVVQVAISNKSEVLVKYEEKKHGHNTAVLNIDSNGFIHTGDLGFVDSDGFLFLKGRKDDVIVLANGKKIFPEEIESKIKEFCRYIYQAFVFTTDNSIIKLVATLPQGLKLTSTRVEDAIINANSMMPDYQKVSCYHIANDVFSSENGMLTASLKMRRDILKDKYRSATFSYL